MIRVLVLLIALSGCSLFKPSPSVTVGNGAESVVSEVEQASDEAAGAKVKAESTGDISTSNVDGIPVWWFMIGCLVAGMIVPQPRFLRLIW